MNGDATVNADDDGAIAGADLNMNGGVSSLTAHLESIASIFGSPYQLASASLTDVPAHWVVNWAGKGFLFETTDASGNPDPIGVASAFLSTSHITGTNNTKLEPFTADGEIEGGSILNSTAGGSRIAYSPFLQEIDKRYYDASSSSSVFSRLRDLYAGSEQLDSGEDHLVARITGGIADIVSFKFTGFQKLLIAPNDNGGHYEFQNPTARTHPLFVGAGL